LESAFQYYSNAYTQEHLPVGKLDEFTLMYMLGEVGRRVGKYPESITWFSKLLAAGTVPQNKLRMPANILEMAKDQIMAAKEEMKQDQEQKTRTEDALKNKEKE